MKKHKIKERIGLVFMNRFELEIKKNYTKLNRPMVIHFKIVEIEKLLNVKIALKISKISK